MKVDINFNGTGKQGPGEMAVVYARYSSHKQGEQSIEGQLTAARSYAEARGYKIIHEYVDRAQTGRNDDRDEFQKMLSDCATKQFSVIIVWRWTGSDATGRKSRSTNTGAKNTASGWSMSQRTWEKARKA